MTASALKEAGDNWLFRQMTAPEPDLPGIVTRLRTEPAAVDGLIAGVGSQRPEVRFGSAKGLSLLAESAPDLLYPHFDFLVKQLDARNKILKWNATRALACLAPADREKKLDAVLEKYLGPIPGPDMIAAATVIRGAATIALAKPELADRLARSILGVRRARYKTDECRNVVIGHAITSFDRFFGLVGDRRSVFAFVRAQLRNTRPATRKKAGAFLKKHAARAA